MNGRVNLKSDGGVVEWSTAVMVVGCLPSSSSLSSEDYTFCGGGVVGRTAA